MTNSPRRVFLGPPLSGKSQQLVELAGRAQAAGLPPGQILLLTFEADQSKDLKARLAAAGRALPVVLTLQDFQTRLLAQFAGPAQVAAPIQLISATARLALIQQAWRSVDGPLWREFSTAPGAIGEAARVFDWISVNRRRFSLGPNEFSELELARAYAAFIRACQERRLVTIQELSLRVLELLAEAKIQREIRARHRLILVDDLHLARPNQLAVLQALWMPEVEVAAAAWLSGQPNDPELRLTCQAVSGWQAEPMATPPGVDPAVQAAAGRVLQAEPAAAALPAGTAGLALAQTFSAEDEIQALAGSLLDAFAADLALRPEDVLVIAADPDLADFAERGLTGAGLPVRRRPRPAGRSPLVRTVLMAWRWAASDPSEIPDDQAFLSLPFLGIDPIDAAALRDAARLRQTSVLNLEPEDWPAFEDAGSGDRLRTVRTALEAFRRSAASADGPASAVRRLMDDLGAVRWAWDQAEAPRPERDAWLSAWAAWLGRLDEVQAVLAGETLSMREWADLGAQLADREAGPADENGLAVLTLGEAKRPSARQAFVIGLSEKAAPRRQPAMQLCREDNLAGLFADGRDIVKPALRDQSVWLERESRALALALTRGRERLALSFSRHSPAGDQQLPSPFFERLLGSEGEFDSDGRLEIPPGGLFTSAPPPPDHAREPGPAPEPPNSPAPYAPPAYSDSMVRAFLECPLKFYFDSVAHGSGTGRPKAERGGLMHEILCAIVGDGRVKDVDLRARQGRPAWLDDSDLLVERARAALAAAWAGQPTELPGGGQYTPAKAWAQCFGPELQREATRRWADLVLTHWARFEAEVLAKTAVLRRPVLLGARFEFLLDGHRLCGRLDRIDEIHTADGISHEIVDYRTGPAGVAAESALRREFLPRPDESPKDYQLPIYAFALANGILGLRAQASSLRLIGLASLVPKSGVPKAKGSRRTGASGLPVSANRVIRLEANPGGDAGAAVSWDVMAGRVRTELGRTLQAMGGSTHRARPEYMACRYCAASSICDRGQGTSGEGEG